MAERLDDLLDRWEDWARQGEALSGEAFLAKLAEGGDAIALSDAEREELFEKIEKLIAVNRRLEKVLSQGDALSTKIFTGERLIDADALFAPLVAGFEPVAGYVLIERLGRGGFGEVWKASSPGNFLVAMKFLPLSAANAAVEKAALDVVRSIRHPNLLPVFGVWENEPFLIIATALADSSLLDRFDAARSKGQSGLAADELLDLFSDVAKALDYLNCPSDKSPSGRRPIQHGDVKPQNILLSGGSVVLGDLGLLRHITPANDAKNTEPAAVTFAYAAPEMLRGEPSPRSDQFSLAMSWCYLRCGKLPFANTSERFSLNKMNSPDLSGIMEYERPILARALSAAPDKRFETCGAFVQALTEAVRPTRPRPVRWFVTGILLVLLLGVLRIFMPISAEEKADRHYQRGLNSLALGKSAEALAQINQALEIYPRHEKALEKRAQIAMAENRLSDALTDAKLLAEIMPHSAEPLLLLGDIALQEEKFQTALDHGLDAEKLEPQNANVKNLIGRARFYLGEYEQAADDFAEAKQLDPNAKPVIDRRGKIVIDFADMTDWNLAIKSLCKLIEIDDSQPQYYLDRGYAYLQLGDYDLALADYDRAIAMAPDNATGLAYRGATEAALGQTDVALSDLNQTVELSPENDQFWLIRGNIKGSVQDFDGSIADLSEVIRLNPESAKAHVLRASGIMELGRYEEAVPDIDRALELIPEYAEAHYLNGMIARSNRNSEQANVNFTKAIRYNPEKGRYYRVRGLTYADEGKNEEALADFDKAIELDPNDVHALAARAGVRDDFEKALDDLSAALKITPDNAVLYISRAMLFLEHDEFQLALADAAKADEVAPDSVLTIQLRAEIYEKMGQPEIA